MDLTTRVSLVQNLLMAKKLPVSVGAKLLDINHSSIYYKGTPVSEAELVCKPPWSDELLEGFRTKEKK